MFVDIFVKVFVYYFIGVNIFAFVVMAYDKIKAKLKKYRVTEKLLINTALVGGSFGTLAAMVVFRHKIRTKKFSIGVPLIIVMQIALYLYIASFLDKIVR